MSEPKYKPTYVEIHEERLLRAVEDFLNPELLKSQSVTRLVKLDDGKWLAKLEWDIRK